jgi:prepilin-type N-terminal cleavage/methylation domain-containing protein
MLSLIQPGGPLRDESGFTLIELLVAMVTSLIVVGATFAFLGVSLHQSSRVSDRVQATQFGRTAMAKLVDELHSACLTSGFAPVQKESSGKTLWFVNTYGEEAIPAKAYEHEVVWTGNLSKPAEPGNLVEFTYPNTAASSWPSFAFERTGGTKRVLGENVYMTETAPGEFAPIFEYSRYAASASSESEHSTTALEEMNLGSSESLSTAQAGEVAAVQVSFTAAPRDNNTKLSRSAPLNSQVIFALGAPASEGTIKDAPCQ